MFHESGPWEFDTEKQFIPTRCFPKDLRRKCFKLMLLIEHLKNLFVFYKNIIKLIMGAIELK